MNEFTINQIFNDTYPPEAAIWCNENRAYIEEIEPVDGVRRFQIVAVPEPTQEEQEAELQTQYTALIQSMLDEEAKKLGYDSCLSVCSYADTGISKFDDERTCFQAMAFRSLEQRL